MHGARQATRFDLRLEVELLGNGVRLTLPDSAATKIETDAVVRWTSPDGAGLQFVSRLRAHEAYALGQLLFAATGAPRGAR